jgi:hypothetical protein
MEREKYEIIRSRIRPGWVTYHKVNGHVVVTDATATRWGAKRRLARRVAGDWALTSMWENIDNKHLTLVYTKKTPRLRRVI